MKYTLYLWHTDDESGYDMVESERFSPSYDYHPETGWRAEPSVKIGEFNTVEELAELLIKEDPKYWTPELAMQDATAIFQWHESEKEE